MTNNDAPAHRTAACAPRAQRIRDLFTGPIAAFVVLALFWAVMLASLREKSLTFDEVAHAAGGYSYWHFGDYRLQPENGQLPQRVAGLPMALSIAPFPAPEKAAWADSEVWRLGYQWLFKSGRNTDGLTMWGRALCGLFAVALGALVWVWSRRLFGPAGGMVSLLLYVMNPTILANGALMTSDMAAALFFTASSWAIWALLQRFTLGRLLLSSFVVAGFFLTKISALLILPAAFLIAVARLADGRPMSVLLGSFSCEIAPRSRQALLIAASVLVHAVVVVAVIWVGYGFRYSAFSESGGSFREPWEYLLAKPGPVQVLGSLNMGEGQKRSAEAIMAAHGASAPVWTNRSLDALAAIRQDVLTSAQAHELDVLLDRPSPEIWARAIEFARRHRLLPEAWLYGFTDVYRRSQVRPAFLNGDFRLRGWPWFFPYTFLVKTPLPFFGVMALALLAIDWKAPKSAPQSRRTNWARFYPTLPLWAFMAVYWVAAVMSHLNIGHRHLLPVYAPLFVLCGAAGSWIESRPTDSRQGSAFKRKIAGAVTLAFLMVWLALEAFGFFPNYLAYFNGLVGPREAYNHLVDSSLDWGQDLPAVRAYMDRHKESSRPWYLSYFGTSSPAYYGIKAQPLFSVPGQDEMDKPDWKNFFLAPDDATASVAELQRQWEDYDLLGMQRLGDLVAVTFLKNPDHLALHAGTYLVSASMLQPVNFNLQGPWGPWNNRYEGIYQELYAAVKPLMGGDRASRVAALMRHRLGEWPGLLSRFEEFRFGRLTAYLRRRGPDDEINYTVLVYRLSEADLAQALDGPPPELGADEATSEKAKIPANGSEKL